MASGFMKRTTLGAAVRAALLATGLAQADGVPGQGSWETTLQLRDIDGDSVTDAFYDTALDITWLRNANVNGEVDWDTAMAWASTLVVAGVGGWRLPEVVDTGAPGCDFSCVGTGCGYNVDTASSEMAHLYYVTLGNLAYCPPEKASCFGAGVPQPGWGLTNTGGFQNLQAFAYWSSTGYAPDPDRVWYSDAYGGLQYDDYKYDTEYVYAMAVCPGDVAAVPEPQTHAMLLLGLGAVTVAARRRPR